MKLNLYHLACSIRNGNQITNLTNILVFSRSTPQVMKFRGGIISKIPGIRRGFPARILQSFKDRLFYSSSL